jgi:hypothetical protein
LCASSAGIEGMTSGAGATAATAMRVVDATRMSSMRNPAW